MHKRAISQRIEEYSLTGLLALQKGIALPIRLAIHLCNVIGYARVSTGDQDAATQVKTLKAARRWEWPELLRLLD